MFAEIITILGLCEYVEKTVDIIKKPIYKVSNEIYTNMYTMSIDIYFVLIAWLYGVLCTMAGIASCRHYYRTKSYKDEIERLKKQLNGFSELKKVEKEIMKESPITKELKKAEPKKTTQSEVMKYLKPAELRKQKEEASMKDIVDNSYNEAGHAKL